MKKYLVILSILSLFLIPNIASAQYVVAAPAPAPAPMAPAPQWRCNGACPTSYFQFSFDLEGSSTQAGGLFKMGYGWGTTAMNNMVSIVLGGHSLSDLNSDIPDEETILGVSYDIYKPLHWSPWFRIGLVAGIYGGLGFYTAYVDDDGSGTIEEDAVGIHAGGKVGMFMSWLPGPLTSYNWYTGDFEYLPNYFELFAKGTINMLDQIGPMTGSSYSNLFVGINLGWWLIFW